MSFQGTAHGSAGSGSGSEDLRASVGSDGQLTREFLEDFLRRSVGGGSGSGVAAGMSNVGIRPVRFPIEES